MFNIALNVLVRNVLIPAALIWALSNSFVNDKFAFFGVTVIVTVLTLIYILIDILKLLPNLALIRNKASLKIIFRVILQLVVVGGYWIVFYVMYISR